eukprot:2248592-Rhodomonas_salina.2
MPLWPDIGLSWASNRRLARKGVGTTIRLVPLAVHTKVPVAVIANLEWTGSRGLVELTINLTILLQNSSVTCAATSSERKFDTVEVTVEREFKTVVWILEKGRGSQKESREDRRSGQRERASATTLSLPLICKILEKLY